MRKIIGDFTDKYNPSYTYLQSFTYKLCIFQESFKENVKHTNDTQKWNKQKKTFKNLNKHLTILIMLGFMANCNLIHSPMILKQKKKVVLFLKHQIYKIVATCF